VTAYEGATRQNLQCWKALLVLFFVFPNVKPMCFWCTIPLHWLVYNASVYIFIQIN